MSVKISVIIPVYNVEKYLKRCVDSVLNQTYTNLEIILVDDGSPDRCPKICDDYRAQDNRVIVIHKDNGGLSSARNAALDYSLTGDYVTYVDSDDWIDPDTFEYCLNLLNKYKAECVQYEVNLTCFSNICPMQPSERVNIYYGKDVLQYFMLRSTIASGGYSVCSCLFQKQLLEGVRFREGKINEDIDYKFKIMQRCMKLVVTNQKKYNYFQSRDSMSSGGLKLRDFQLRESADILCDLASQEHYGTIAFLGKVKKARTAFSLLCKIAFYGISDTTIDKKQIIKDLLSEHRSNFITLMKSPIPMSRKVLVVMFFLNYKTTEVFVKIVKNFLQ